MQAGIPWLGLALAGSLSLASGALAAGDWVAGADDAGDPRVTARIVVHPHERAGRRIRAGVQFRLDPGWHLYWKNPGDSGIATEVTWRDADASALAWPAPSAFEEAEGQLVTFGYEGAFLLSSWLAPALGAQRLGADVSLLVCRASCIPAELSLTAPLAASVADRAELQALFAAHDAALAIGPEEFGVTVSAAIGADPAVAVLSIAPCAGRDACRAIAPPAQGPVFFSEDASAGIREIGRREATGALEIVLRSEGGEPLGPRAYGIVRLTDAQGVARALEVDAPIAGAAIEAARAGLTTGAQLATPEDRSPSTSNSLVAMVALALLGGLVLNLMPCVLPVLALKAFAVGGLAERGRREALHHGLAYAGGVLLSMLALAAVTVGLRGAGHAVGWGFQFQEPIYVAGISALLTGFALNLFGVFEIGFQPHALASVGAEAPGARRSFFEGLLAVALATPCSAPFLGTAIGFAFASPAWMIATIFLAIGIGLAAPFVFISAFPSLGRFLPRSGAWMGSLRAGLGFALLGTVVWLLWIVGRSAGPDALAALLALLVAGSFVAWLYGRMQRLGSRFAGAGALAAVAALVLAGANLVQVTVARGASTRAVALPVGSADAWSLVAVEAALSAGRPVFVYFTADWCLTCKLNERLAVDTAETRALLGDGNFAVLRGDWTQRDEAIRRELARHGKAGVPLYLVYSPDSPDDPQVLPELLTQDLLAEALRSAR